MQQSTVRLSPVFIRWVKHQADTAFLNLIFWIKQKFCEIRFHVFDTSEKDIYDKYDTVSSIQSASCKTLALSQSQQTNQSNLNRSGV